MDDVLNGLKTGASGHRFHRSKNHSTSICWNDSYRMMYWHKLLSDLMTHLSQAGSQFFCRRPKVSPSDRAGCLVVRLGGIHLNSPADWEREITHTLSPYPYLCLTWEQPNRFYSKLLKITFLLYELRSSNSGGIPAFNILIFISAVRKCNHGVSSAGTAARSCVH